MERRKSSAARGRKGSRRVSIAEQLPHYSGTGSFSSLADALRRLSGTPVGSYRGDAFEQDIIDTYHHIDTEPPNPEPFVEHLRSLLLPSTTTRYLQLGVSPTPVEDVATSKLVIEPDGPFRVHWNACMVLLLIVNVFLVPLDLAFFPGYDQMEWMYFYFVTDSIFLCDIILNFVTGIRYFDGERRGTIRNNKTIALRYLKGWFIVDLLSCLPFDGIIWLVEESCNSSWCFTLHQTVGLLGLLKLLKISRLVRYGGHAEQTIFYQETGVYLQLVNLLALIAVVIHWHACLQFYVPLMTGFPARSWVVEANIKDSPWTVQYTYCMFASVSQIMTCGFGAVVPALPAEEWVLLLGMFVGAVLEALLLANALNIVEDMDYTNRFHRERVQEIDVYMGYWGVRRSLQRKVRDYISQRYDKKVFDEEAILGALSETLREDVLRHKCRKTLRAVPFFVNMGHDFTNEIMTRLKPEFYQPMDVIIRQDTRGTKVFFIDLGTVKVITNDGDEVGTLSACAYFGELCLLRPVVRQVNVVAVTYCHLFSLTAADFQDVLQGHPGILQAFKELREEEVLDTGVVPDVIMPSAVASEAESYMYQMRSSLMGLWHRQ